MTIHVLSCAKLLIQCTVILLAGFLLAQTLLKNIPTIYKVLHGNSYAAE